MQAVSLACNIAKNIAVTARLGVDIVEIATIDDISKLKLTSVVARTSILVLDLISMIGGEAGKFSEETLLNLKGVEIILRTGETSIRFTDILIQENTKGWTVEGILRLIEQGAIAPISGLIGNALQISVLNEKFFLKQVEENPDAERPIYEYNPITHRLEQVGSKKIDPKECQDNIALFSKIRDAANATAATSEIGVVEGIYRVMIRDLLRRNINQQQRQEVPALLAQAPHVIGQPVAPQLPNNIVDIDQMLDLPSLQRIPQYFDNDRIFKKYICPISLAPIRYITRDTTAKDVNGRMLNCYYEKTEILKYLAVTHNPKSVHSNLPISINDLVDDPIAQAEIDQRLDFHKNAIINYLGQQLNA